MLNEMSDYMVTRLIHNLSDRIEKLENAFKKIRRPIPQQVREEIEFNRSVLTTLKKQYKEN